MERARRFGVFPIAALVPFAFLATLGSGCTKTLPDGTHFGFVHEVSGGELVFDPAEFLGGDEATAAYLARGEEQSEPHFIDNPRIERIRLRVEPSAQFQLLAYDDTGTPMLQKSLTYDELAALCVTGEDDELMSATFGSQELGLPMYLTIMDGRSTGGVEQYLP